MKTTGYMLRDAIRAWEIRRETASGSFNDSLRKFPGEVKPTPAEIVTKIENCELSLAKLQTAQMQYNLSVEVEVKGTRMTLAEAIKRIGGIGRVQKMWKTAIEGGAKDRHSIYGDDTRDPTQIRSEVTIHRDDASKLATQARRNQGLFQAAIAVANDKSILIENLDPSLFE